MAFASLTIAAVAAVGIVASGVFDDKSAPARPVGAQQNAATVPGDGSPTTSLTSTTAPTAAGALTPSASTSLPTVNLPAGPVLPAKAPKADPTIVARIKASSNARWDVNYLALIDQAARTHDAPALDHLLR